MNMYKIKHRNKTCTPLPPTDERNRLSVIINAVTKHNIVINNTATGSWCDALAQPLALFFCIRTCWTALAIGLFYTTLHICIGANRALRTLVGALALVGGTIATIRTFCAACCFLEGENGHVCDGFTVGACWTRQHYSLVTVITRLTYL